MVGASPSSRGRIVLECGRIRERLRSLTLNRIAPIAELVHVAVETILHSDLRLEGRPMRQLPRLGDEALEAQLGVVSSDLLAAAGPQDEVVLTETADALTDLRRSLP
jgi:hypothetical protein